MTPANSVAATAPGLSSIFPVASGLVPGTGAPSTGSPGTASSATAAGSSGAGLATEEPPTVGELDGVVCAGEVDGEVGGVVDGEVDGDVLGLPDVDGEPLSDGVPDGDTLGDPGAVGVQLGVPPGAVPPPVLWPGAGDVPPGPAEVGYVRWLLAEVWCLGVGDDEL